MCWCRAAGVQMRLIEIGREEVEGLPKEYDPDLIAQFWGARPWAVATRVAQLASIAGGFLSSIAMDIITKRTKEVSLVFETVRLCKLEC